MCCNSQQCSGTQGFQPTICVQDISKGKQAFLSVDITTPGTAAAALGGANATLAGSLARIGVKCVKLDPCCTSTLSFVSAANLADFLENTTAITDAATAAMQNYLTGKYTCGQSCC